MRIVCISDTHLQHSVHKIKIPDGDMLIHAGDLTICGNYLETAEAGQWLKSLPHKYKVVIAGNHDFLFQSDKQKAKMALDATGELIYLQDETAIVEGIKIYGSPWTPRFYDWAFQLADRRPEEARPFLLKAGDPKYPDPDEHWAKIPLETQLLITHGPPYGTLDRVIRRRPRVNPLRGDSETTYSEKTGCVALARRIKELPHLKLHVFGHIHPGHGVERDSQVTYVNAATCDNVYIPSNPPIVVDIDF